MYDNSATTITLEAVATFCCRTIARWVYARFKGGIIFVRKGASIFPACGPAPLHA